MEKIGQNGTKWIISTLFAALGLSIGIIIAGFPFVKAITAESICNASQEVKIIYLESRYDMIMSEFKMLKDDQKIVIENQLKILGLLQGK